MDKIGSMAAKPNSDINLLRHIYEVSEWINSISVIAGKKKKKKEDFCVRQT